jgi:hypothetical protein
VETKKRRTVADSGPRGESHAQPAAPLAPRGQGLDRMRRMKMYVASDGKNIWGRGWAGFSTPTPLKPFGGPLGGRVEMLLHLLSVLLISEEMFIQSY